MTTSRRGFLKILTQISVAIAAAPAVNVLTKFIPPPAELEAVYSALTFSQMLNMYLPQELLMQELMSRNYLLEKLEPKSAKAFNGMGFVLPFSKGKV